VLALGLLWGAWGPPPCVALGPRSLRELRSFGPRRLARDPCANVVADIPVPLQIRSGVSFRHKGLVRLNGHLPEHGVRHHVLILALETPEGFLEGQSLVHCSAQIVLGKRGANWLLQLFDSGNGLLFGAHLYCADKRTPLLKALRRRLPRGVSVCRLSVRCLLFEVPADSGGFDEILVGGLDLPRPLDQFGLRELAFTTIDAEFETRLIRCHGLL
jgi:hypothetical protein